MEATPTIEEACKNVLGEQVYRALRSHLSAQFANEYDNNKKYNGWTNYETWLVNLHLTNEGTELVDLSRELDAYKYTKQNFVYRLARKYKEHFNELTHEIIEEMPYLIKDLTISAMQEVDWHSIAEHVANDYYEESDFDTDDEDD